MNKTKLIQANILDSKIDNLSTFLDLCKNHNGIFLRAFNTHGSQEYSVEGGERDIIIKALEEIKNNYEREFDKL